MIVGYPKQLGPQVPKPQRLVEPDKVTIAFYLRAKSIDLFTDSAAAILNFIVLNSCYGMPRGQISMYSRPPPHLLEHPIIATGNN